MVTVDRMVHCVFMCTHLTLDLFVTAGGGVSDCSAGAGCGDAGHDHGHGDADGDAAAEGETSRYSIQTCFDLLGELCKFNIEAVMLLEHMPYFSHDPAELAASAVPPSTNNVIADLIRAACGRLIDSNVFFRSLFLTFEAARGTEAALLLEKSQVLVCAVLGVALT